MLHARGQLGGTGDAARAGVARAVGPVELRLEATAVTPRPSAQPDQKPEAVIGSVSYFF